MTGFQDCHQLFFVSYNTNTVMIESIKNKVLDGGHIYEGEATYLYTLKDKPSLYSSAEQITKRNMSKCFDMCSIINAKSGRCGEDCHWCAQSIFNNTGCKTYELMDSDTILKQAGYCQAQGVKRFSIVCSGGKSTKTEIKKICSTIEAIRNNTNLKVCASLGLLDKDDLKQLQSSGLGRYHCNLESASSHFVKVCSTHTTAQKLKTLGYAKEIGLEVCSGGIIGMGESAKQRIELAFELKNAEVDSVPINILNPIKGTPLENQKGLTDEDILTTLAVFRFILPKTSLRFAGGRRTLSSQSVQKAMRIAVNSAIVGDMLTTLGNDIKRDKELIIRAGYEL